MQKKVKDIANIASGYTFRESIKKDEKQDILVVQAKNISTEQDIFSEDDLVGVSHEGIRNPYLLEHNDILIVAKGSTPSSFKSSVFSSHARNVIAASSLHIIRINDVTVLPKYVSLYFNSIEGQKVITRIVSGGSYIQNILIRDLSDLEIPIPPIHIQKSIIALHENLVLQEKILAQKHEIKKNIINATFINLIK